MLRIVTVSRIWPWQRQIQRLWATPIIADQTGFALLMWAGYLVFVLGATIAVGRFTDIPASGWESASDVVQWYVAGVTGWSVWHYLPLMVAHGITRHEAARYLAVFIVTLAGFVTGLTALGYLIEAVVYRVAGWRQDIGDGHLFASPRDVHLMVLEYGLTYLVWGGAGALIGAGIYRNDVLGWLTWLPALILVGVTGTVTQWYTGPVQFFADRLIDTGTLPLPVVLLINLACVAAALGMAWTLVRGMPLRSR